MKDEINRMYRRIQKAQRRIAKKKRVDEETARIVRLKQILTERGERLS